jgi:hypothetical protein
MSATKAALKSELNIRTRTTNKIEKEKLDEYTPTNLLAEQTIDAVNEYFDAREEVYQDLPDDVDKDDLELTADVFSNVPYIAPRLNETSGLYNNLGYSGKGVTSKNTISTNLPFINLGGITFANNYNAYGLKNSTIPEEGLTKEKIRKGFYNDFQYITPKFYGNISDDALLNSMGYPSMTKFQGTVL